MEKDLSFSQVLEGTIEIKIKRKIPEMESAPEAQPLNGSGCSTRKRNRNGERAPINH